MGPIIDLSTLLPWRIMQIFATTFAYYNILRTIAKDKFGPLSTFCAIFAARIGTSLLFYNSDNSRSVLGYLVYSIIIFLISLFLTTGELYKKVIAILFWLVSNFSCMFGLAALYSIIYNTTLEKMYTYEYQEHMYTYMVSCIVFIAASFLFSGILKLAQSKKAHDRSKKMFAYITFIPFSHVMVVAIALFTKPGTYTGTTAAEKLTNFSIYIFLLLVMLFDASYPFVIEYFEKIHQQNIISDREILRNKMDYNQMVMLKDEKQRYRKIKHDFANITATAAGLIEIGKPEKALHVLRKTNDDITNIYQFSLCSNDAINTTVFIKEQEAEKLGVELKVEIDEAYPVMADDYDVCRILFNIADNSVAAAAKLKKDKISKIKIEITQDEIIFESENGKPKGYENRLQNKADEHGYGTKIIGEIAAKYGGKYKHKIENGVYYTKTTMKNKPAEAE